MSVEKAKESLGQFKALTESKTVVKENLNRRQLHLANPSAKDIYLALGPTAEAKKGIWLKKESVYPYPIEGYTGPVTCIGAEAAEFVVFTEV